MAVVPDARSNILQEEVRYRAAASEAIMTKAAGSINFINNRQAEFIDFKVNGFYKAPFNRIDGMYVFTKDCSIYAYSMSHAIAGSAGSAEFDIIWFNGSGSNQGSIFSTKPAINFASGDDAYQYRNLTLGTSGGVGTIGVISKVDFDEGDAVRCDLLQAQTGGFTTQITLEVRPR